MNEFYNAPPVFEVMVFSSYKGEQGFNTELFRRREDAREYYLHMVEVAKAEMGKDVIIEECTDTYFSAYYGREEWSISLSEKQVG